MPLERIVLARRTCLEHVCTRLVNFKNVVKNPTLGWVAQVHVHVHVHERVGVYRD